MVWLAGGSRGAGARERDELRVCELRFFSCCHNSVSVSGSVSRATHTRCVGLFFFILVFFVARALRNLCPRTPEPALTTHTAGVLGGLGGLAGWLFNHLLELC